LEHEFEPSNNTRHSPTLIQYREIQSQRNKKAI
jgi:hypothetical protein